ncbi:uncharacterized protein LY89DRAFT_210803 [Mollisia scopiformis]|uniref:Uncharacterized protein n=1 Tax=Mollisia scopiformis TaxID=149040 RepID=A0A194WYB4_MOLSC|nr:uncharacterized protein LY89DRAFT_210803 [Mollisia scopiformis]KUJ12597.1 hypothetical protein LY89DRAFT_210803 [Mollisia scopiformis]
MAFRPPSGPRLEERCPCQAGVSRWAFASLTSGNMSRTMDVRNFSPRAASLRGEVSVLHHLEIVGSSLIRSFVPSGRAAKPVLAQSIRCVSCCSVGRVFLPFPSELRCVVSRCVDCGCGCGCGGWMNASRRERCCAAAGHPLLGSLIYSCPAKVQRALEGY